MNIDSSILTSDVKIQFTDFEDIDGVIYHKFKIISKERRINIEIKDRFSKIREFYQRIKNLTPHC